MDGGAVELVYFALLMRTIPILCGFGSVCLGFYLFIKGIGGTSSSAGGWGAVRFVVRRAAPGIFFAVLGAAVMIATVLHSGVKVKQTGHVDVSDGSKPDLGFTIDIEARVPRSKVDLFDPSETRMDESAECTAEQLSQPEMEAP